MYSLFRHVAVVLLFCSALFPASSAANERVFSYTYQSNVLAQGQREIEIWNTFHFQRETFYRKLAHRIEYEIGLGRSVQTAFYFNITNTAELTKDPTATITKGIEFGFSNEWKFKLSDPSADALGSALYGELGVLNDEIEFEGKIILDKQIGNTTHALNITAEPAWATGIQGNGTATEFGLRLEVLYGFSYRVDNNWNLGFELRNSNAYSKDAGWKYSALFGGPAAMYRTDGWWVTLTVMPQIYAFTVQPGNLNNHLELKSHERLETRLLFSYEL